MSKTCCGVGCGGKNRLDNIQIFQVPTLEKTGRYFWLGFKMLTVSDEISNFCVTLPLEDSKQIEEMLALAS